MTDIMKKDTLPLLMQSMQEAERLLLLEKDHQGLTTIGAMTLRSVRQWQDSVKYLISVEQKD